jgi:hypothetical protein
LTLNELYQRREAKRAEREREEWHIAMLTMPHYASKGTTLRQFRNKMFGYQTDLPDVRMDEEARKSMEADQPDWLRERIEATRKKNLEAWDEYERAKATDS